MKIIILLTILLVLVSCNSADSQPSSNLVPSNQVTSGVWRYEDEDAICNQIYTNGISCYAKNLNPEAKKTIYKESVRVSEGIWKFEDKTSICYMLYTNSIDCIPNLKKD